ncbi:MAG: host attachment protein [Sulfurovum sp.]|nr:host attachment protein [Sulfurovum sp.]
MKFKNSMIIVADLGELKGYRIRKNEAIVGNKIKSSYTLKLHNNISYIDARKKLHEVVTDNAGRFGQHIAEEHNLETERKRRSLEDLADDINKIVEKEQPKQLFLAFPQELNTQLLNLLSPAIKTLLVKNLTSNLVKINKEKLLSYFE